MPIRVLIVTSCVSDADTLTKALLSAENDAFKIICVGRLSEALERLQCVAIDAVLADLYLPDSCGIETFERILAVASDIPMVILGETEDAATIEAMRRGAQGYFSKSTFSSYLVSQSLRNIAQRAPDEDQFYIGKARAQVTLNSISDAVIGTDANTHVDYLNAAAEKLTGWSKAEAHGRPISEVMKIVNGATGAAEPNRFDEAIKGNVSMVMTPGTMLVRRDGSEVMIEDSLAPIHDLNGKVSGAVIVFHDVSAVRQMSIKMAHLAQYDFLTNLPNRVLLNDRIAQCIAMADRQKTALAILFLDLDNFKHINDSLGHAAGDSLLQSVAKRLTGCVRGSDTVSRLGGDEFVVLVSNESLAGSATLTADKIIAAMAEPFDVDGRTLHVTTSIGISTYPGDSHNAEALLQNADIAMYEAKKFGRNNFQFFKSAMNARAVERQEIEVSLRRALSCREFELYYQPKVNLNTGAITGVEALLRWNHPTDGLMLPDRFIPVAEACGLIIPIGRWVLKQACKQARAWQDLGLCPESVAVNISALEFRQKGFVEGVRAALLETGIEPSRLQLEITESVLMRDALSSTEILQELKDMGVLLAVDDFGTGYSSLSYLNQFPIDTLKIDRSFVCDIGSGNGDGIIVSAVIAMGNSLKHRVVAEGIEDLLQLHFLKGQCCEEGQGFLFSKPLIADQFSALLAAGLPLVTNL